MQVQNDDLLIIMEYLPLGNLYDYIIKQTQPLNILQIQNFALGISSGMQCLHSLNIVHRDLACRNIFLFLDNAGNLGVKVGDLGMSRAKIGQPLPLFQ